jgi:DNA damage-inducible protein 1
MQLTVAAWDDRIFSIALDGGETLDTLKAVLEAESGVPAAQQRLLLNGKPLAASGGGDGAAAPTPTLTLAAAGMADGDMLMLLPPPSAAEPAGGGAARSGRAPASNGGGGPDAALRDAVALGPDGKALRPAAFIQAAKASPQLLAQLERAFPPVADAVRAEDPAALQAALGRLRAAQEEDLQRQRAEDALLEADPFDAEAQAKIEALIRRKNVEESYEQAMEHAPEMFAPVTMLYCHMEVRLGGFGGGGGKGGGNMARRGSPPPPAKKRSHDDDRINPPTPPPNKTTTTTTNNNHAQVNGVPVKAFIDSGAQMTIMTEDFARRCHLERLLDTRFHGTAVGVGSSRILGRVHAAPMKVSGHFITSSITVLEQKSGPQFIFGLDMLKRHRCRLEFAPDAKAPTGGGGGDGGGGGGGGTAGGSAAEFVSGPHLFFGSCGVALPFLGDSEIPKDFAHDALEDRSEEAAAKSMSQAAGAPSGDGGKEAAGAGAAAGGGDAAAAAAGAAAAAASGGGGAAAAKPAAPDDDKVSRLMALGFPRGVCEEALRAAEGNEDAAAAMLFGGSQ